MQAGLKEYFMIYITEVRKCTISTMKHYLDALNNISKRLKDMNLVKTDIYEVTSLEELSKLREILYADADFCALDTRGKRMYSAGLNNYYRFASGIDLGQIQGSFQLMDVPIIPKPDVEVLQTRHMRSNILKVQALQAANYTCELNNEHKTFVSDNNKPYMEGHHALPLSLQKHFETSLDVYANIVCLCPLCHRQIHYGLTTARADMMEQIYNARAERLEHSGIGISKDDFIENALSAR